MIGTGNDNAIPCTEELDLWDEQSNELGRDITWFFKELPNTNN